jgi:4-alpha-glucanotransferase
MPDRYPRSSGILLHPTSLPGPYGIGDVGPIAHAWVDTLARAKQIWWQVLPIGPTGFGDSPYQSFSTFAGNLNLISPDLLIRDGLLSREEVGGRHFPADRVDYAAIEPFKLGLVRRAWEHYQNGRAGGLKSAFEAFVHAKRDWVDDYARFMALKDVHRGAPWYDWAPEYRRRGATAPADAVAAYRFGQFLFFRQWDELRRHARDKDIRLIGDVPIFVAPDSADVWANPHLYLLDKNLRPRVVAGVPPDYFSRTGQLWGNPHYDWEAMRKTGFAWWIARLKATLEFVDVVRLDHFRGFLAAWQVPAKEKTAIVGEWVPGPAEDLFTKLKTELGDLPLIAEDLGEITPDVFALRDKLGLPGMKILQFAFDKPTNPFLPHNYPANCVAYTGTHDNDTTRGWYATAPEIEKDYFRRYTGRDGSDVTWDLIRLAWASVPDLAITPMQDVLDHGTDSRMNLPGTAEGNWKWRMPESGLNEWSASRLVAMTEVYGRVPKAAKEKS